jgi:hypothetical protein
MFRVRLACPGRTCVLRLILILAFDDPHGPQSDNRPWDDAEYHTNLEFDR